MKILYEVVEVTNIRGDFLDEWDETPICWFWLECKANEFAQELFNFYGLDRVFNVIEIYEDEIASPKGPVNVSDI